MLSFTGREEAPTFYIKDAVALRNGSAPRNLTPTQVDGEPWFQYSANYPYDPAKPVSSFVYGRLGRFVQSE
jgi:hypothetical protein